MIEMVGALMLERALRLNGADARKALRLNGRKQSLL